MELEQPTAIFQESDATSSLEPRLTAWLIQDSLTERNLYSCLLGRYSSPIRNQLRSFRPWHRRTGPSELSKILLQPVPYVHRYTWPGLRLTTLFEGNFFDGLNLLGVPTEFDPNDGTSAGAAFCPTDLDPNNQTRSDARRSYYDPYVSRNNLYVTCGQHVTQVLIEGILANADASNQSPGGGGDGDGSASQSGGLFGIGSDAPVSSGNSTSSRFTKRSGGLRVTGVEVGSVMILCSSAYNGH